MVSLGLRHPTLVLVYLIWRGRSSSTSACVVSVAKKSGLVTLHGLFGGSGADRTDKCPGKTRAKGGNCSGDVAKPEFLTSRQAPATVAVKERVIILHKNIILYR